MTAEGRRQTGALVDPRVACRCDPDWCTSEADPEDMADPSKWCRWCAVIGDPEAPCPAEAPEVYASAAARSQS